jgi:hypothetical protein
MLACSSPRLIYASHISGLRAIQIETSVWPLRREAENKEVISFIAEAYGRAPELPKIACSSLLETATEKLVALTWRQLASG